MRFCSSTFRCTQLLWLVALSSGCASAIDATPFENFRAATRDLSDGTAELFEVDRVWTSRAFVHRIIEGEFDYEQLVVEFPADPDSFDLTLRSPPLFVIVAEADRQMARLNGAFNEYADLLLQLAGSDVVTDAIFDNSARELNDGVSDVARRLADLGVHFPSGFDGATGLISTAAAEAFRGYVHGKRRAALRVALERNQATVDGWSEVAIEALRNLRDDLRGEYLNRKRTLADEIAIATASKKQRLAEELVDLQLALLATTDRLIALRDMYAAVPRTHYEIARALGPETSRPSQP